MADPSDPAFKDAEQVRAEWVIRIDGKVVAREGDTVNPNLPTGEVEVRIGALEVLSKAEELPLPVFGEPDYPEDIAAQIPLPRSAPRDDAPQHHDARRRSSPRSAGA